MRPMTIRGLDRHQLETFATIVAEGSFERAAVLLNISRGAVSQRIKALEDALAAVVLTRERPAAATPAGELLLRHVNAMCLSEQATIAALRPGDTDVSAPVSIAVNADSLANWFQPVLWEVLVQLPISIEVVTDDQDHTLTRLKGGQVVACVSAEPRALPGFVARPLGRMDYKCFASEQFATRHFPHGLTLPAALKAPAALFSRKDSLHNAFLSRRFGISIGNYKRHYLPAPMTLLESVLCGVGYAMLPVIQLEGRRDCGTLVDLAPEHVMSVDLYWHHWEHQSPILDAMTACVLRHARERLPANRSVDATGSVSEAGNMAAQG